jgi:Zn-dependent metalloprotease
LAPSIFDHEALVHFNRLLDVYNFYGTFGRNSLDNKNGEITSYLMWSEDGSDHNNAYADRKLRFGAGSGFHENWGTIIDIVGHEATHNGEFYLEYWRISA